MEKKMYRACWIINNGEDVGQVNFGDFDRIKTVVKRYVSLRVKDNKHGWWGVYRVTEDGEKEKFPIEQGYITKKERNNEEGELRGFYDEWENVFR